MKKWILLISVPLVLIVILLAVSFYIYPYLQSQRGQQNSTETPAQECIDSSDIELPEEVLTILKESCITEYTKEGSDINLVLNLQNTTYPEVLYSLRQTEWKVSNIEEDSSAVTFTLSDKELTVSKENEDVYISLRTKKSSIPDTNNNTSTPQPAPKPQPVNSDTGYKVTSTEISRISTTEKIVVFTFDGGAGIQSLDKILAVLDMHNVKGSFFVTGKWADEQTSSLKKISGAGHEVFNHTYSHPNLTTLTDSQIRTELSTAESKISAVTGRTTKPFYRPPYGARDSRVREVAANAGYQTVYWTVDALDWKESEGITEQEVKNRILNNVTPGTIYLMHIGDNITGNILDEVFVEIESRGYQIKSLSEVLIKN